MMKLPSIESAISQLITTLKRFPLTIICSFIGTYVLIHIIRHDWYDYAREGNEQGMFGWARVAMCAELGLCIFMAVALFCETKGLSLMYKIVLNLVGLGLLSAYYFSINHYEHFKVEHFTRYSLYIIASHLLVAFSPFIGKGQINGFWQFNRALFLRFLLSFLYTVILYGGICIGMWLMDDLLHFPIHGKYYLYAWFCMVGVFNTLFFLAGVPQNIAELDSDTSYLKGLKAFTQFVLLPLVTMYLLILYAYMLRVLLIGHLPKGYVSYLVISFSGMGILSLLLIYPLRDQDENKWIKIFSKWFYWALYPLILLLAFSIYHRVSEYGITADRYFIILLAVWLACIAAYFLFSKKENIKVIPISLCFIAVFASFGPWGAFSFSAKSQQRQLEKLLTANKVLNNGKMSKDAAMNAPDSIKYRIESVIEYLVTTGEVEVLQPYVKQNLDSLDNAYSYSRYGYSYGEKQTIMGFMGFTGYENYASYSGSNDYDKYRHITFSREYKNESDGYTIAVSGYSYYTHLNDYYHTDENLTSPDTTVSFTRILAGPDTFSLVQFKQPCKFGIVLKGKIVAVLDLQNYLIDMCKKHDPDNSGYMTIPENEFSVTLQGSGYQFKFMLKNVTVVVKDNKYYITDFKADALIGHYVNVY